MFFELFGTGKKITPRKPVSLKDLLLKKKGGTLDSPLPESVGDESTEVRTLLPRRGASKAAAQSPLPPSAPPKLRVVLDDETGEFYQVDVANMVNLGDLQEGVERQFKKGQVTVTNKDPDTGEELPPLPDASDPQISRVFLGDEKAHADAHNQGIANRIRSYLPYLNEHSTAVQGLPRV